MSDPHLINTIIASAICDCGKDHPDGEIPAEQTKQIAKCIVEHLASSGYRVVHVDEPPVPPAK